MYAPGRGYFSIAARLLKWWGETSSTRIRCYNLHEAYYAPSQVKKSAVFLIFQQAVFIWVFHLQPVGSMSVFST